MLKIRLIPALLLKGGRMVKPIRFGASGERDVGDPAATARIYDSQDADELLFLDIEATKAGRGFLADTLKSVAKNCFVPLTAGGGVRTLSDIEVLLSSGADKISVNTAALEDPAFIDLAARRFGSQCVVVSIDYKLEGGKRVVFGRRGTQASGRGLLEWAREAAGRGAGELLITSIDREGTMTGYDLEAIKEVSAAVRVPVIANGGASSRADFARAIKEGGASAVAASSVFHFSDSNLTQVKSFLLNEGISMRPL